MILLGLVVLAVGFRWFVIGRELGRLDDPDGYLGLARSLARGEGLRINGRLTAYRPPLYPVLLAPWVQAFDGPGLASALAVFHLGLGAITVLLVADSARRWGIPRWGGWVAVVIVGFDPVLVVQARALMTETLAACLVAAMVWGCSLGGNCGAAWGGIGFGLASLCRPSLLPAAALTALVWLAGGPIGRPARVTRSLVLVVATLAVLCPWAIRNALVLGEPVWTTTHGGYTLALANNPAYYADVLHGPPGSVWSGANQDAWISSITAATAGRAEPDADRLLRQQAVACARDHPADFLRASLARLGRFWGVMPSSAVYPPPLRWATAAWTVPIWIAVLLGLARRTSWQWPRFAAVAPVVTLTLIHSVYWTDLRMRAPLVPALALVAASGVAGFRRHGPGASSPQEIGGPS